MAPLTSTAYSTRLSGLLQVMSRHTYRAHVIHQVSPSPAVGSSGSYCTESMTSIYPAERDPQFVPELPLPKNPHNKKDLVSSPV